MDYEEVSNLLNHVISSGCNCISKVTPH